jgi:sporulation protein YlmC with PRC-barrel domain
VIRASDLIGCRVCTESGAKLGRVHDLRAHAAGGGWVLMGLVVGRRGILERFGGGDDEPVRAGNVIPWQAVVRLADGLVTVRDEMAAVR